MLYVSFTLSMPIGVVVSSSGTTRRASSACNVESEAPEAPEAGTHLSARWIRLAAGAGVEYSDIATVDESSSFIASFPYGSCHVDTWPGSLNEPIKACVSESNMLIAFSLVGLFDFT